MTVRRFFSWCTGAMVMAAAVGLSAQGPATERTRATGDQRRQYYFAPTGQQLPYRLFVPPTWDGKTSLPIILMLHGGGANENSYMDMSGGLLPKLAAQHGYIVVSPLGFTPLGAFGNPLRLPAVYGESAAAATQRAAVTPVRQRELSLSELDVITVLDLVTEEYGADRSRTFLAGHSMGSGGAWHLAARYPERWRAVAPMSGPFIDATTYPFDLIRRLPIFMTEGTGATPSLAGSRALAQFMRGGNFIFEYLEVDGDHGGMVPMVWPRVFEFFNRYKTPAPPRPVAPGPYAVQVESYPTLATHTAYHPAALESFGPSKRLPIVAWGNGTCARNGSAFATFLTQIESHGYLAWLDYQLKGSAEAAKWFVGADGRLCTEPIWTVQKKGMR